MASVIQLRRARAAAQLLTERRARAPADIVRHLLAVQAQDLRSARLALRARGAGFTAADIDAALTHERSLVIAWLCRGTLHLVAADDHAWLLTALATPLRFTANARRLRQEGVTPDAAEKAVRLIARALAADGPLTRAELAERVASGGIRTEGQAMPHLLMLAALRGIAVLGPLRTDGTHAFALARDWLPKAKPPAREKALAELARRYHAAHAHATAHDLAAWAGLPLRDTRTPAHAPRAHSTAGVPPRLLPAYDPYLLGFADRGFAVPATLARQVHPGGGTFRPTATVDGRVVATWSKPDDAPARFAAEATDVRRFEARGAFPD